MSKSNPSQQMMGPEAMGVSNANLHWSDEKVCKNFLCGTCPHTLFTNTVRSLSPSLRSATHGACAENGPRRMPQVAHGAAEDRVPRRARGEPDGPHLRALPDGIRVEHLCIRRRVRPQDPRGAQAAGEDARGEREDDELGASSACACCAACCLLMFCR